MSVTAWYTSSILGIFYRRFPITPYFMTVILIILLYSKFLSSDIWYTYRNDILSLSQFLLKRPGVFYRVVDIENFMIRVILCLFAVMTYGLLTKMEESF